MKFNKLFVLLPILASCVQGTVSDSVSLDKTLSFNLPTVPTPPPGVPVPVVTDTVSQSTPVDLSDVVSKLTSVGQPSFQLSSSTITGNVSFVTHVEVDLTEGSSSDAGSSSPPLVVVNTDLNSSANVNNLPLVASGSDLLNVLGNGPASLTVSLTVSSGQGTMPSGGQLSLEYVLNLQASESITKSF